MDECRLCRAHRDGAQRSMGRHDPAERKKEHRSEGRRDGGLLLQTSSKHDWSGDGQQMMSVKCRASGARIALLPVSTEKTHFKCDRSPKVLPQAGGTLCREMHLIRQQGICSRDQRLRRKLLSFLRMPS